MMKRIKRLIFALLLAVSMNMPGILLATGTGGFRAALFLIAAFLFFLYANIAPPFQDRSVSSDAKRLKQLGKGSALILYAGLSFLPGLFLAVFSFRGISGWTAGKIILYVLAVLCWLCGEGLLLLGGCLRLFSTSVQMGVRYRLLLLLGWWVPVLNLFLFYRLYELAEREYETELEKEELNAVRKENECCHTRYPLLLVHGVFFRDSRFLNYWGRIPKELLRNGASVYYGGQQSAASVASCGEELAERIKNLVEETGCGKVNIIAHSKGGLDARYAIARCGAADFTASLTTINTPHRGCFFADYLLEKAPEGLRQFLAARYNGTLRRLGDSSPDFLSAVEDLTAKACLARNGNLPDCPDVYYRSVATSMKKAAGGRFPLNMSYHLVKHFDGENDGLVSVDSALWGDVYAILRPRGNRGISHGDMIDLNRENIPEFDVREFYVNLVEDLKEKGF